MNSTMISMRSAQSKKVDHAGQNDAGSASLEHFGITDNRAVAVVQRQEKENIQSSPKAVLQRQSFESSLGRSIPSPNDTGMPDSLKDGLEQLSGFDLSDVRVHYNSNKPSGVGALAYAQGNQIHLGPGQEKHLPHEGWHVVQQKQGRVTPTMRIRETLINDNVGLEAEADLMSRKAANLHTEERLTPYENTGIQTNSSQAVIQCEGLGDYTRTQAMYYRLAVEKGWKKEAQETLNILNTIFSQLNPKAEGAFLWVTIDDLPLHEYLYVNETDIKGEYPIESEKKDHSENKFVRQYLPLIVALARKSFTNSGKKTKIIFEVNKSPCGACSPLLAKEMPKYNDIIETHIKFIGPYPGGALSKPTKPEDLESLAQAGLNPDIVDLSIFADIIEDSDIPIDNLVAKEFSQAVRGSMKTLPSSLDVQKLKNFGSTTSRFSGLVRKSKKGKFALKANQPDLPKQPEDPDKLKRESIVAAVNKNCDWETWKERVKGNHHAVVEFETMQTRLEFAAYSNPEFILMNTWADKFKDKTFETYREEIIALMPDDTFPLQYDFVFKISTQLALDWIKNNQ